MDQEKIIGPAILFEGEVYAMSAPARHNDIFAQYAEEHNGVITCKLSSGVQGFITSKGRFVNRFEGMEIAKIAKQVQRYTGSSKELFTEDMW